MAKTIDPAKLQALAAAVQAAHEAKGAAAKLEQEALAALQKENDLHAKTVAQMKKESEALVAQRSEAHTAALKAHSKSIDQSNAANAALHAYLTVEE